MIFAFIGCKTDYYLSLKRSFSEKNSQLLIYTTIDAFLSEPLKDGYTFNALVIDYDSHTSSYNLTIAQCLTMLHPNTSILFLISQNSTVIDSLESIDNIAYLDKSLPIEDIALQIYTTTLQKPSEPKKRLQIGENYVFDMRSSVLRYKNIIQPLTKKESAFLRLLIEMGDTFTSLDEMSRLMYPHSSDDKQVALRSLVMRLRKKLSEEIIETYPKLGYRLKPFSELILKEGGIHDKEI